MFSVSRARRESHIPRGRAPDEKGLTIGSLSSHLGPPPWSGNRPDHEGMCRMRTVLRRLLALVVMAVLAGIGAAATAWSPTTAGLVSPASAQEEDGDDDDD